MQLKGLSGGGVMITVNAGFCSKLNMRYLYKNKIKAYDSVFVLNDAQADSVVLRFFMLSTSLTASGKIK